MSLWKNLQSWLGRAEPAGDEPQINFDQELVNHLQYLAQAERRSPNELARELMNNALAQRQEAEEALERWRALSPREQEVTALTCLGYTNQQIAKRLKISSETVKTHIRNVEIKFGVSRKSSLRQALSPWDFSSWD